MKRVVAAVALLFVAGAVVFVCDYIFEKEITALENELNVLIDISDSVTEKELLGRAEKIADNWGKSSGMLRSIVLHDGVDELGRSISSLPQMIEHTGRDEMKKMCIEAINMIKNLRECEEIRIENIL